MRRSKRVSKIPGKLRGTTYEDFFKAGISNREESKPEESSVPDPHEASAARAESPEQELSKPSKLTGSSVKRLQKHVRFESPRKIKKLEKPMATALEEPELNNSTDQIDDSDEDDGKVGTSRGRYNPKEAYKKVYGFIGVGAMGSKLVLRLLKFKLKVVIWNRTQEKCDELVVAGAQSVPSPRDVIHMADITFSCLSSPKDLQTTFYHPRGVLQAISEGKGYVEMTGIDIETSRAVADSIENQGGRYLELQISGTVQEAEKGQLILLGAHSRSLFNECKIAFRAMSKRTMFYGSTGCAIKLNLLLQGTRAVMGCCIAEFLALAKEDKIWEPDFTELLKETGASSLYLEETVDAINQGCASRQSTKNTVKELKHLLNWSASLHRPMPLAASASQMLIHAVKQGYGEKDDSAVFFRF